MSSIRMKVTKRPAIKHIVANPIIDKKGILVENLNREVKKVKSLDESPFKKYGTTIFSEISINAKQLNSSSSSSVAVLNKVNEKLEIKEVLDLYFEEKNSCSRIINRKTENSA